MAETDTVVARLRDPWKHSEELCTEAATELARLQAENEALRRERDELRTCAQDLPAVLEGTADRLVRVLGDNPKITFVLTLRECAKRLNAALKA
jgi:hypothetical protein